MKVLLARVTDDHILHVLRALPRRTGLEPLARLLGFTAALRRRGVPRGLASAVRSALSTRRGDLRLHAFRIRRPMTTSLARALLHACHAEDPAAHHIAIVLEPRCRRVAVVCNALGDGVRHVLIEPAAVRPVDIDVVRELAQCSTQVGSAAAFTVLRALDRRTLTDRFFRDVRAVRDLLARSWTGLPESARADRDALALLLLSRLMFLYFLQRDGLLAGDDRFLPRLLARWQRRSSSGTFYRTVLRTLFFGVLNRRPERRTPRATSLGELPYLNGGLFEMHRVEQRHPSTDLADDVTSAVFGLLLERYRFTATDTADSTSDEIAGGIDPELLGRIFEGLMPCERRSRTGTFYTPADTVDRVVKECLAQHFGRQCGIDEAALFRLFAGEPHDLAIRDLAALNGAAASLRMLDPACGSGAFLLAALARIAQLRSAGVPSARVDLLRRDIVAASLHGVDLLDDAALICALRVWLALVPRGALVTDVPPLPNLDRCIRQGDSLVDPLETTLDDVAWAGARRMRMIVRQLQPIAREYVTSGPETRAALRRRIRRLELGLARVWLGSAAARAESRLAELRARTRDRDLFGQPSAGALAARGHVPMLERRLTELRRAADDIATSGRVPFFSFPVHFASAEPGFDIILSNPPWVRAHAWPVATAALLRERYRVCRDAGWPFAARLSRTPAGAGAQVDIALLFLERSVGLLRPGGTLGMLLPAKLLRSLAPGAARALLLSDALVTCIEDHSLDHRAVFHADAFTAVIIARREAALESPVRVRMTRGSSSDLEFDVERSELPLRRGDHRAPWLLAPPDCAAALRAMQGAGRAVGELGLAVRRGAMTNANGSMLLAQVVPRIGHLVEITTLSGAHGIVEQHCIRPVLRGADIRRWSAHHSRHVLWSPANDAEGARPPRRFATFVRRHVRTGHSAHSGRVQRISDGMFGHKVVWSDLAADLRAAAVRATVRTCGAAQPVIPLNTVYFIPVADRTHALLLAAYFNSLPVRTFARAIAERAKDAHFRFFAWTVAMLPLPADWRTNAFAARLTELAAEAHDSSTLGPGAEDELNDIVARCYRLSGAQLGALRAFDSWLKGDAVELTHR